MKPSPKQAMLALIVAALILSPATAQKRRTPARSRGVAAPASTPAVPVKSPAPERRGSAPSEEAERTFDGLLASDSYAVYGEVRMIGQLIRSNDLNELLQPLRLLAGSDLPPEITALMGFVSANADPLSNVNISFTLMPTKPGLPESLVGVKFSSIETANSFEPKIRQLLSSLTANQARPQGAPAAKRAVQKTSRGETVSQRFAVKRVGNLLLMSDKPFTLKSLRAEKNQTFSQDVRFQQARARLSSEQLFVFLNVGLMEQNSKVLREQHEEKIRVAQTEAIADAQNAQLKNPEGQSARVSGSEMTRVAPTASAQTVDADPALFPPDDRAMVYGDPKQLPTEAPPGDEGSDLTMSGEITAEERNAQRPTGDERAKEATQPEAIIEANPFGMLSSMLFSAAFSDMPQWPEAVGVGVAFEGADFTVRVLLMNEAGRQTPVIPFVPFTIPGPPITAEAASIVPADTDIFVSASLDIPKIYEAVVERMSSVYEMQRAEISAEAGKDAAARVSTAELEKAQAESEAAAAANIRALEQKYKIRIKEELLPLLGNEVAIAAPLSYFTRSAIPRRRDAAQESSGFVILVSLKNKDALREMLPRVFEAMGLKVLMQVAGTEKKGDVEIINYANGSLAFVKDFLIIASDAASIRQLTDAYAKGETLQAASDDFRTSTEWQPRQKIAQVYVARTLMEGMLTELKNWSNPAEAGARNVFASLNLDATAAINYAATSDGLGLMHELRLPKNLVKLWAASMTLGMKQSPLMINETQAISALGYIATAEEQYKETTGKGRYATLEQLQEAKLIPKTFLETLNYKIELSASGSTFNATATPSEYGKTGRRSFFIDETRTLRAADHAGQRATASDEAIN